MRRLMVGAALVVALTGCRGAAEVANRTPTPVEQSSQVTVYVDSARNVVCYYVDAGSLDGGVSIDCLELSQP